MNLTGKEKEIILLLAREGLKTRYDLFKKGGGIVSSSTAHNLLKDLGEKGLIKVEREEAFRIRGRKKKLYGLTFKGLISVFLQRESRKYIDKIVERQEKLLPLILGKWQHFQKSGVNEEQFYNALQRVCVMAQFYEQETLKRVMVLFSEYVFTMTDFDETIAWLKAFHGDRELRGWALVEGLYYTGGVAILETMFNLIRQANPDWMEGFHRLCRISQMPMRAYTEEDREILEKELLEQVERKQTRT